MYIMSDVYDLCDKCLSACVRTYTYAYKKILQSHTHRQRERSNEMKFTKSGEKFSVITRSHCITCNKCETRKQNSLFHITTTYCSMNLLRFTLLFNFSVFFFLQQIHSAFVSFIFFVIKISITIEFFFLHFRIAIFGLNNFT